ncbi:ATP-dependent nuclease [Myxococcus faecalis]|uniref:ATP-dependent nuclease n=1 Tax=Myxococcus faecalis TaxID=3115646 RepID=UPI0038D0C23A
MHIKQLTIQNYKSFMQASITFMPGVNIITGRNNSGKTALLEAASLVPRNKPHRSIRTGTNRPNSAFLATIALSIGDIERVIKASRTGEQFQLPIQQQTEGVALNPATLWHTALKRGYWEIQAEFKHKKTSEMSGQNIQRPMATSQGYITLHCDKTTGEVALLGSTATPVNNLGATLIQEFTRNTYAFKAERLNIGCYGFGTSIDLSPDASNLPEVLHVLQSENPSRFERYNKLIQRIFPQVRAVRSRPVANNQLEIVIWPIEPATERSDLAIPLTESGTGIGQALAILYVIISSQSPRTIIIDEPNSFLHPGASRTLLEILREHPQHQYIISTHSPETISASEPTTIHIIKNTDGISDVVAIDPAKVGDLQSLLLETGSRLSDVFGADNVLWVEGPTEQACFPKIIRGILRRPISGVSVLGVLQTGDFDSKTNASNAFRIYSRLTGQGNALLPPAIAFVFDRELRSEQDRTGLMKLGKDRIFFLSRRTYENYLLHAGAIAAILTSEASLEISQLEPGKIQEFLDAHVADKKYYQHSANKDPVADVDAPLLLQDLFYAFSEDKLRYNKIQHSIALTDWLIENHPEQLREISDLIRKILDTHPASKTSS